MVALATTGCGDGHRASAVTRPAAYVITIGKSQARVEIASTPQERERGLMGRTALGANEGMLFLFADYQKRAFWMKDTKIPLSIAFVTRDGLIADIQDMEPETMTLHQSSQPAIMALEMPKGWFERNGVKVGDGITLPTDLVPREIR